MLGSSPIYPICSHSLVFRSIYFTLHELVERISSKSSNDNIQLLPVLKGGCSTVTQYLISMKSNLLVQLNRSMDLF